MKRIAPIIIFLLFATILVKAQPAFDFKSKTLHLGFVHQGDTLHFQFEFTNTGNEPLVISETKVECGCTIVDKPAQPTLPGKQGILKVAFVTNTAIDRQDRTVTIISNVPGDPAVVRFKCIVQKPKKK